ncbi:MAG: hypothetical protein KC619_11255 [Myxococcales bacterium]|nr:hypothetical protein [Myxococcales bacterium]
MRNLLGALAFAAVLACTGAAFADVIPDCPSGQRFQSNPVEPGALHHSGGECVEDETAEQGGGCTVRPGQAAGLPALFGIGLALGLVARRRR